MISRLSALNNISRNSISSLFHNVSYIFKENSHQCIVHFQRAGCILSQFICHMQKQAISYFCQVRSGKELKTLLFFLHCVAERERYLSYGPIYVLLRIQHYCLGRKKKRVPDDFFRLRRYPTDAFQFRKTLGGDRPDIGRRLDGARTITCRASCRRPATV